MARHVVDWEFLRASLEEALRVRQVSLRRAAKEMGLPPTTLAAVRKGKPLNADGTVSLVMWVWLPVRTPVWITDTWVKEV